MERELFRSDLTGRAKFDDHIALTRATPASAAKYLSNLCRFKRSTSRSCKKKEKNLVRAAL